MSGYFVNDDAVSIVEDAPTPASSPTLLTNQTPTAASTLAAVPKSKGRLRVQQQSCCENDISEDGVVEETETAAAERGRNWSTTTENTETKRDTECCIQNKRQ